MPPKAVRRYGEPMALRRIQVRARFCVWAVLASFATLSVTAQSQNEDAFHALLQKGFQLHQQARFSEAIPVLVRAQTLEPGDYFANLLLGIDLLRIGKAAEAVPLLKLAAHARPTEEFPEDYLGEAEAALGEQALAAEAYQRAVLRGHNSEQSLETWAGFALERFRWIGAELRASEQGLEVARRLQKAAAASESDSAKVTGCAVSIPVLERRLAAKQVRLDSDAAYRLSICYAVEAGNAAAQLQTGAENMAAVHRLRGDVLLRLKGDAQAAEAEYKEAIIMYPRDPELLERLAEAQLAAGDTEGARQSSQSALAIDPHRRAALHTLVELAMSDRDYERALPWLRQLAAEAPGDRATGVELGRALAQTGDAGGALQYLAPALGAGYPDEKGALHALMARVLHALGRDAEAARAEAEARRLSDAYQARGPKSGRDRDNSKGVDFESPDAN